jgi:hypothetical protein
MAARPRRTVIPAGAADPGPRHAARGWVRAGPRLSESDILDGLAPADGGGRAPRAAGQVSRFSPAGPWDGPYGCSAPDLSRRPSPAAGPFAQLKAH